MKIAVPCPVLTLCKQIPHRLLERRRLALRKEKVEGDLGDEGLAKRDDNLGLLFVGFLGLGLGLAAVEVVLH